MDTLVLSTAYQPMNKISWQEAMKLWASGRVEIVAEYSDRFIKTSSKLYNVPSVIRFVKNAFKRFRRGLKFSKKAVYDRDNGRCQYCSDKLSLREATKDHVFPSSRGGKTSWTNIVIACKPCNSAKKNKTPEEAGMQLLTQPDKPKFLKIEDSLLSEGYPDEWKIWLGVE